MTPDRPTVLVARHGETAWNRAGRIQGGTDTPLSDVGLAQARALADRLALESIARVVSSDLARARVTAEVVARACGVPLELDARLREIGLGEWEGLTWDEVEARDPELKRTFKSRDPDVRPPGGETRGEAQARAWAALEEHGSLATGKLVLLVTHGAVLQGLVRHALGIAPGVMHSFRTPNASLFTFVREGGRWFARGLSDTSHLPADPNASPEF